MTKYFWAVCFFLCSTSLLAQLYQVPNSLRYTDPINPSMEVFLVKSSQASIQYQGTSEGPYQWYRFFSDGSKEPVEGGQSSKLTGMEADRGYYLQTAGNEAGKYVWLVNYEQAKAQFDGLSILTGEDECAFVGLQFTDLAPELSYYLPTGYRYPISRQYIVSYTTLNTQSYSPVVRTETLGPSRKVEAPLCDTSFKLIDSYAQNLGMDVSIESDEYAAIAVHATRLEPELESREAANEVKKGDALSAPVQASFTAQANRPVASFFVWTVYKTDESTTDPIMRYTDSQLRYTFDRSGTYRVDLDISDRTSRCSFPTIQYEYEITDSFIDVPNVFSPEGSPGINDVFKVAYRSITHFKGIIVNRWGQKLFEWKDPAEGWDGYYKGKLVPPGVYFYIIEWQGADGRKGVKKGDINILGTKQ